MQTFGKGISEKEIPTLHPVKKVKEDTPPSPEATPDSDTSPLQEEAIATGIFTNEELKQAWNRFRESKLSEGIPDSLKMVLKLNQELNRLGDMQLEIFLSTEIERKFLQNAEMEMVQFLRRELKNDRISLVATVKAAEVKQRLYTDKEKFNYLAEKQPLLLKLKEKLFLDTEF